MELLEKLATVVENNNQTNDDSLLQDLKKSEQESPLNDLNDQQPLSKRQLKKIRKKEKWLKSRPEKRYSNSNHQLFNLTGLLFGGQIFT